MNKGTQKKEINKKDWEVIEKVLCRRLCSIDDEVKEIAMNNDLIKKEEGETINFWVKQIQEKREEYKKIERVWYKVK